MNTNKFTKDGIEYIFVDSENSLTVPYVWKELIQDAYGLESLNLTENDTVIDIGANVGMFSIYIKKKFNCKVISFEPVPRNFENFKKNIELNGLSTTDFELHNVAITDEENGEIQIGTPSTNSGGSSIFETTTNTTKSICKTETIGKYIDRGCTYFKIDCEGGEYSVIPQILNRLNEFKYIGIEYHSYNNQQDALLLNEKMKDSFDGLIFSNILDPQASWNINR